MSSNHLTNPTLILTAGEPAGIGPNLCVQISQLDLPCKLVVIANRELLQDRARKMQIPMKLIDYKPSVVEKHNSGNLHVINVPLNKPSIPGKLDSSNARYVLETLEYAVKGCCRGEFDGMVTAPVHKGIINDAGINFTGHTEYLSELTNSQAVMMLVGQNMRVALATTHLPLKDVASAITYEKLEQQIRIINHELITRFAITMPRIAVAGLNPHAGESGYLGSEEIETIIPVLKELRLENINLIGPLPADTLFVPANLKDFDCIFVMYHDQGLPVLKHASFGESVNVTLGLPIIRTSVDHGTALDLVTAGKPNSQSLLAAIKIAIKLVRNKNLNN